MNAVVLSEVPQPIVDPSAGGYAIGAIIALLIFIYLLYSLIKPEKF